MPNSIPQWKNKDPKNKDFEELAIILRQILDYLDAVDQRLIDGGL